MPVAVKTLLVPIQSLNHRNPSLKELNGRGFGKEAQPSHAGAIKSSEKYLQSRCKYKEGVPSESVRSRALHKSPGASHCFHLFLGAVWRSGLLSKAWFVMEDDVIHTMLGERD